MKEWQYIRRDVVFSGVEPALAYVPAHVAESADLDELARELEVFVKSELAGPSKFERKPIGYISTW